MSAKPKSTENELATIGEKPLQAADPVTTMLAVLERAASNPDVDVEKMERLMAMCERQTAKVAEQHFFSAMTAAQAEIVRIAADKKNSQTRSEYASYAQLDRFLRPIYSKHGFALVFGTEPAEGDMVIVTCDVSHSGGHYRTYRIPMPADGKGAKGGDVMTKTHATGSAVSYGRRYLLQLIFNVAIGIDKEDDDGNAASLPRITQEQAANIHALLDEVGRSKWESKFLSYLKVESVEAIPAQAYKDAIHALEKKRGA